MSQQGPRHLEGRIMEKRATVDGVDYTWSAYRVTSTRDWMVTLWLGAPPERKLLEKRVSGDGAPLGTIPSGFVREMVEESLLLPPG